MKFSQCDADPLKQNEEITFEFFWKWSEQKNN